MNDEQKPYLATLPGEPEPVRVGFFDRDEDLNDTVMVEMTRYLWEVIAEGMGAVLDSIDPTRLIEVGDLGKQLFTPTLSKRDGPR